MTLLLVALAVFVVVSVNRFPKLSNYNRLGHMFVGGAAYVALALCAAPAFAQSTYRDPGGAFTVSVPAGWKADKEQDSNQVTISKGEVAVAVQVNFINDGSTPTAREVLDDIEKQMKQDSCSQVSHRGNTAVAGQPGEYFFMTCTIPEHGEMGDTVAVAVTNGKVTIISTSAAPSQFDAAVADIQLIAKSFRLTAGSPGAGRESEPNRPPAARGGNSGSGANAQKLKALEGACSAGLISPEDCDRKRAELTQGEDSPNPAENSPQMEALRRACQAKVFTDEECEQKRAALLGGRANPAPGGGNVPRQPQQPDSPTGGYDTGDLYKDPRGAFSLLIPKGWEAKTKTGCYGPPEGCPQGATGVNIGHGNGWVFVAPFSGNASEPKDVVMSVAGDYQSDYKNFNMTESDQRKINGVDVAFATFTGVGQDGTPVSLILAGVAAPNGRFFLVASSLPQNEPQSSSQDLDTMFNSLRFLGR